MPLEALWVDTGGALWSEQAGKVVSCVVIGRIARVIRPPAESPALRLSLPGTTTPCRGTALREPNNLIHGM